MQDSPGLIRHLPVHLLKDYPLRTGFYDQAHLEGLVLSIKESGQWEPVLVRALSDSGEYQILSGHCRVRAIRRLKRSTVLCQVLACDDRAAKLIFCSSRMLTRSLSAIEEAFILKELVAGDSMTMAAAGQLFGRSKWWVSRRLKLLDDLEPAVQAEVGRGKLQPRLAQELCRVPRGTPDQLRLLSLIREYHLSKEELAHLVDHWLKADEAEKDKLCASFESAWAGGGGGRKRRRAASDGELELYAAHQLQISTKVLNELMSVISGAAVPVVDWWPTLAYKNFLAALRKLGDVLGPDVVGGGDLPIAQIEI